MASTKAPAFVDRNGRPVAYDGAAIAWRPSIYVVAMREGAVLMERSPWTERLMLPGGEVATDESLLAGAQRECYEETGYAFRPDVADPVFVVEQFFAQDGYRHALTFVVAGEVAADPDPAWIPPADEISEVVWAPLKTLQPAAVHPISWAALERAGLVKVESL